MNEEGLSNPSDRRRIEETVLQILNASDLETATVLSVRAAAAERLGFELSGFAHRHLVQQLIDSYLLSNADSILGTAKDNDGGDKIGVNGEQRRKQQQQVKSGAVGSQSNFLGKFTCKLSNRRWVTIHDSYGMTVVSFRDFFAKDGNMLPSKAANAGINLTRSQWSSFRNSFHSIEEAIVKLESQLRKHTVPPLNNPSSGLEVVAKPSEAVLKLTNPMADPAVQQSQVGKEISNLAEIVHSPVKRKHPENEAVVNLETGNSGSSRIVHPFMKRRHTEADTSSSGNAWNSQEHILAERKAEETSGSVIALESEENAHSERKSHSARLIPIQPGRFDGRNYHSWRHHMGFFLNQLNIAYVLTVPCPSISTIPEANFEEKVIIQRWIDDDYLCRHNILNSLSDSLFQLHSQKAQSAKDLWEELDTAYNDDFGTKRSEINKYIHFQMVDGISILDQVDKLHKIGKSIIASGTMIDENFHVSVIISKLPSSWKDFRVRLMHEGYVSFNALIRRLQVEEDVRKYKKGDGIECGGGRKWEKKRVCYSCGKEGHIIKYCPNQKFDAGKRIDEKEHNNNDNNNADDIIAEAAGTKE